MLQPKRLVQKLAGQFASRNWPDLFDLIHEGHEGPRSTETAKDAKSAKAIDFWLLECCFKERYLFR